MKKDTKEFLSIVLTVFIGLPILFFLMTLAVGIAVSLVS